MNLWPTWAGAGEVEDDDETEDEQVSNEAKPKPVRLGGLWEAKDRNGQTYLSGSLGGGQVLIFKNTKKDNENSPDWNLYLAEQAKRRADQ